MTSLTVLGIVLGISLIAGALYAKQKRLHTLNAYKLQLAQRSAAQDQRDLALNAKNETIVHLAEQKAVGFPWLAEAYADFFHLEEMQLARSLERKKHPAFKAADEVRHAGQRRREAEKRARLVEYLLKYYETLFPWLAEFRSEEIQDELIRVRSPSVDDTADEDPAQRWLTPEEYRRLPNSEKYELALERYWTKKKTKWEIGRDYERYIGHLYERDGHVVRYQGIIEGFDDLGRDLIVKRKHDTQVVQCKHWSKEKTIHEKHIFQLYGTFIAYRYEHPSETVSVRFVTSTKLSDRAKGFADHLGIEVSDRLSLVRYPCVKCNVSRQSGERIYHLPFDQQYDRTIIEREKGECYVETVKAAESLGFRRAFRYKGSRE